MWRTISRKQVPAMDSSWRKQIASNLLNNLCEKRLARTICVQFQYVSAFASNDEYVICHASNR